jgi:phytanoyl-CoA hydroxylase
MEQVLTQSEVNQFNEQGYSIIPNFVSLDMCNLLMERSLKLIKDFDPGEFKTVFSTKDQRHAKQLYFLDSGDQIRFFFEDGAFDAEGQLKYDKSQSINKIGHALHILDPLYHCFSHSHKIAQLSKDLAIDTPRIAQSMYICKQPYIGGEVTCHQDSTYLYVKDKPVIGFWFALEDATIENGCLWAIPGGHHTPLKSRLLRDHLNQTSVEVYNDCAWPLEKMVPLEVSKGSLIILHGHLPHMSKENTSSKSRHAYSIHIVSGCHEYDKKNWLQKTNGEEFTGFI